MRKYILSTLLLLVGVGISAQNKVTISGTILDDKDKSTVPQASVRVLNQKDSTYVAGTASDMNGRFSMQVNRGNYILQFSYLGYSDSFLNVNAANSNNSVGEIYLKENSILLQETVITAKAIEVMVKGDTIEYNADSYTSQPSSMAEDVFKNMPGAEVDSDGNIKINGKTVTKILVDGKEFFGDDPKIASKNLPASIINKVQVFDKKSDMAQMTGFDDGDDETVINLTIKKGMKQGVSGNAYAGYGSSGRYEVNGIVNYMHENSQFSILGGTNNTNNAGFSDFASSMFSGNRPPRGMSFGGRNGISTATNGGFNFATETSDKLKWGGNVRYGDVDNDVNRDTYTEYYHNNPDSVQYETRYSRGNNISRNLGANFRFEWKPDSLTTIIFRPNLRYNRNSNSQENEFATLWANGDSVNWGSSNYYSDGKGLDLNGRLEVSRQLGKPGRVLSLSLSGGISNQRSDRRNWSETFFEKDPTKTIDQIFDQKNDSRNWRGFLSYVEPIGKDNFLQLTYSYRNNHSESDKKTYSYNDVTEDYDKLDASATSLLENDFVNQEIGLNFRANREKYNYLVGFAVQPSKSESWDSRLDTVIYTKTDVVNFAPVAQFNYEWNKQRNLRINYNGRVNQPSTKQLSSARDESDPMDISYGNPDLKPSFNNRFRLRYRDYNSDRASNLNIDGNFNFTTNAIVSDIIRQSNGQKESTYRNINGNWDASAGLSYNTPLKNNKKISISTDTDGSYSESKSFLNGEENKQTNFNIRERVGFNYRLESKIDLRVKGNFNYTSSKSNLTEQNNRSFFNYGGSLETTVNLPFKFILDTDITYSTNSGYANDFKENQWLWNAALTRELFSKGANTGTIRVKIYDILQQRSNISQSSTGEYLQQSITNTINSYFMVYFVYKFNIFKNGAKASDMEHRGPRGYGRPDGPGGPNFM